MQQRIRNTAELVVVFKKQACGAWASHIKLPITGPAAINLFGRKSQQAGAIPLNKILPQDLQAHHDKLIDKMLNTEMYDENGKLDPLWEGFIGHDQGQPAAPSKKEFFVVSIEDGISNSVATSVNISIAPLRISKTKFAFQIVMQPTSETETLSHDKCEEPAYSLLPSFLTRRQQTIMLVDDSQMVMMILLNHLGIKFTAEVRGLYNSGGGLIPEKVGSTQIIIANDGKTALEYFERYRPDLIITDIHMREMNGDALIKNIEAIRQGHPVIYLLNTNAVLKEKMEIGLDLAKTDTTRFRFITSLSLTHKLKQIAAPANDNYKRMK